MRQLQPRSRRSQCTLPGMHQLDARAVRVERGVLARALDRGQLEQARDRARAAGRVDDEVGRAAQRLRAPAPALSASNADAVAVRLALDAHASARSAARPRARAREQRRVEAVARHVVRVGRLAPRPRRSGSRARRSGGRRTSRPACTWLYFATSSSTPRSRRNGITAGTSDSPMMIGGRLPRVKQRDLDARARASQVASAAPDGPPPTIATLRTARAPHARRNHRRAPQAFQRALTRRAPRCETPRRDGRGAAKRSRRASTRSCAYELLAVGRRLHAAVDLVDAGLDSLAVTQLLLAIEESTGVWVDESLLTEETLASAESLAACVHAPSSPRA